MKKLFLILLVGLFIMSNVFAQCPDEKAINSQIAECKGKGMNYEVSYDEQQCQTVKCFEFQQIETPTNTQTASGVICPSDAELSAKMKECEVNGKMASIIADEKDCKNVTCVETNVLSKTSTTEILCSSDKELNSKIAECQAYGKLANGYQDAQGCKNIMCVDKVFEATPLKIAIKQQCMEAETINKIIMDCKAKGMLSDLFTDQDGCKQVKCYDKPTITSCPSEEQVNQQITKCKDIGYGYDFYYDQQQCKQVKCAAIAIPNQITAIVPTVCLSETDLYKYISKCKENKLDYYFYYDQQQCKQVACGGKVTEQPIAITTTIACPSEENLYQIITKCKDSKMDYSFYYDQWQCKQVACKQSMTSNCLTQQGLDEQIIKCKKQGWDYKYEKDGLGCAYIKCFEQECNTAELENEIRDCEKQGGSYKIYQDEKGCKKAKCLTNEGIIPCKKYIDEKGCITVSCNDGFYYNSCMNEQMCRIECKTYTDSDGCMVKSCTDGYFARECPKEKEKIECKVYKDEKGCETKKCTDGYVATYCPTVDCKKYTDEQGCTVKTCTDGYTAKECPTTTTTPEPAVECKVYKDEKGCEIKECTNGYRVNSCDKGQKEECKKDVMDNGCVLVSCANGYEKKDCPTNVAPSPIECKVYKENNCKIKVCTDGYADKVCEGGITGTVNITGGSTAGPTGEPSTVVGGTTTVSGGTQTPNIFSGFFDWLFGFFKSKPLEKAPSTGECIGTDCTTVTNVEKGCTGKECPFPNVK